MGYCFHHWLSVTSKDTLWIFPEDESVVCFQMTVKHSESACFRSRPVIMLPSREIVRLLNKFLGQRQKKVACIIWDHTKQNFCSLDGGCITWKTRTHFQGCWLILQQSAVGWRKQNLGGDSEELVVSMGVCVTTEPQAGVWLLLPAAAALQCVIPLDPATAAQSPWAQWPPRLPCVIPTERLNGRPCWHPGSGWESPGISEMTKQAWGKRQAKLINWQSLLSFHFHISSECFKQKQWKVQRFNR